LIEPFIRRERWVQAFAILMGLFFLSDLFQQNWGSCLLSGTCAFAGFSVWKSMRCFRRAQSTGRWEEFEDGVEELVRYVKVSTVAGYILLAVTVVAILKILTLLGQLGGLSGVMHAVQQHGGSLPNLSQLTQPPQGKI
jgi:hypothetical protein